MRAHEAATSCTISKYNCYNLLLLERSRFTLFMFEIPKVFAQFMFAFPKEQMHFIHLRFPFQVSSNTHPILNCAEDSTSIAFTALGIPQESASSRVFA